jgi:DNA-binding NtrC family response regulator
MKSAFKILVVDDELEYRETSRILLESEGYAVGDVGSAAEALELLEKEYYPIVLTDINMPRQGGMELLLQIKKIYGEKVEVIIVTGFGSVENAVKAMKIGAFGYFIKSRDPAELFLEIERAKRLIKLEVSDKIENNKFESNIFLRQTKNDRMKKIIEDIDQFSKSRSNILLLGESGVGKEILAKAIHNSSDRSEMGFIPINCQAISEGLLESELFGHEKGAFTGALSRRVGRFEEANGGSIFLDEIGEMTLSTQIKLLRVLDSRQIERIGSNKSINVDFRLISATNKKINKAIKAGEFREDLFYRINTFIIDIPPLRERREDIEGMIDFFIDHYRTELKKNISGVDSKTKEFLLNYNYPGNVRELKNMIERMAVLSTDGILRLDNNKSVPKVGKPIEEVVPFKDARREFEINYITNVLNTTENNITRAATLMNISRRQLFNKIVEYNIKDKFK